MLTASLIDSFEATLEEVPIVAIFIPLIAGMAGNAGTQSLAVAVRGIAVGNYGAQKKFRFMLREISTGLFVGAVCGIVVILLIFVWKGNLFLGILVGIAILATLTLATLSGALIPLLMDRLGIDPAVASGPFITTLNDVTSVIIYFGMATAFMGLLL
jgi:magnesium transporter